jgi:hypothetical protein
MIFFVKPGLTEDVFIAKGRTFNNVLHVRYVHWIKIKPIHKKQTHPLVREDVAIGL